MKVVMVKLEHTQQQITTTFRAFTALHTTIHDFTLQQQQNLHYFCITPQQFQQFAACPGENPFFPRESETTPKGNAPVEQPTRNEEAPHVVVEPQQARTKPKQEGMNKEEEEDADEESPFEPEPEDFFDEHPLQGAIGKTNLALNLLHLGCIY